MIKRRRTSQVKVGNVKIGGDAPVSIQSMVKAGTSSISTVVSEIRALEACGCEIVRVAVKNFKDAEAIRKIKKNIRIPIVGDIHFNYRLALESIKNGVDKIRLNPGNIRRREEIARIVKAAKRAKIPIRIGVNSGSVSRDQGPSALIDSALGYTKLFEEMDFHDIIISLKASSVVATVDAYRRMAVLCNYPLHLGLTASGPSDQGIIKSSIGIGALLLDGIGDTIRVSLTADPVDEVIAAKRILSSLGLRHFGPDIISCPTCGRCQVNLVKIVNELERKLPVASCQLSDNKPMRIAVMGCEVNGPGEARGAEIGIAFGKGSGMLFKNGKIVKKVTIKNAVNELLKLISND